MIEQPRLSYLTWGAVPSRFVHDFQVGREVGSVSTTIPERRCAPKNRMNGAFCVGRF